MHPVRCAGLSLTLDPEVVAWRWTRQSIEKKDFPIGRRGYDPDAVDAHLQGLADEIDELKKSSRRRSETLASSASEQVRAIVEAAETSAAEIQRQAEEEAREIRAEAASEARRHARAGDHPGARVRRQGVGVDVGDDAATRRDGERAWRADRGAADRLQPSERRPQLLEGNLEEVKDAVAPRAAVRARARGPSRRSCEPVEEKAATFGERRGRRAPSPSPRPEPVLDPVVEATPAAEPIEDPVAAAPAEGAEDTRERG